MWHQISFKETIAGLNTDTKKGLSATEAQARLIKYGKNILPTGKKTTWWQFLLRQFKSPLVYILLVSSIITIILGEWVDTIVILLAVFVNVAVGFWQEFKSNHMIEKLRNIVQVRAWTIRDGAMHELDACDFVPGDIIILKPGIKIPADARLISSRGLEINEALLTGESLPVKKDPNAKIEQNALVGDRYNMVHMGTITEKGEGMAVVVATGKHTEIGKIALLTQKAKDVETPLQIRMGRLGNIITFFVMVFTIIIFGVGILQGHSFREMFTTAIAVAVAAIPEGMPATISIILAVSAGRILNKKGVIKRLLAAETLGSASVICTDKTNTITEGKMKVEKLIAKDSMEDAYTVLALSNEAIIEIDEKGERNIKGDSTDKAKMQIFFDTGHNLDKLKQNLPRVAMLPFNSLRKYIASFHSSGKDTNICQIFVSGASEIILENTSYVIEGTSIKEITQKKKKEILIQAETLARQGYRVIALAKKENNCSIQPIDFTSDEELEHMISGMTFSGLAAIGDPIREDVKTSIITAREAGIEIVMLTGDHKLTAIAIGEKLGFPITPDTVMEGKELDVIPNEKLSEIVQKVRIFARVSPEHKMRIIEGWRNHKDKVVAMTGDGINDAPALKAADIGIALGSGTDVAKEASDLILSDDSFSTIVSAIEQGRVAFDNIRKVVVFLFANSFTEIILVLASLILQIPLPITAVQILWTNLVEDALPNIALAFEPGEKDIMKRKPIQKNERILDSESRTIIFVVGILTDFILVGMFLWLYKVVQLPIEYVRTFVFAALGLDSLFYIFSIKSLRKPIWKCNIFSNKYLVAATMLGLIIMTGAVYIPFLNTLLGTVPLTMHDVGIILFLSILEIVLVEIAKWWFWGREKNQSQNFTTLSVS